MGGKNASTALIAANLEKKKRLESFDHFNVDFVDHYMVQRYQDRLPERNKEA